MVTLVVVVGSVDVVVELEPHDEVEVVLALLVVFVEVVDVEVVLELLL